MFVVNCLRFAFLYLVNVFIFCCSLYLVRVLIVVIMRRWYRVECVFCVPCRAVV